MIKQTALAGLACLAIVIALSAIPLVSPVSYTEAIGDSSGNFTVGGPRIDVYPQGGLSFTATVDGENPADQTLDIWNSGTDIINWTLNWTGTYDPNGNMTWLNTSPKSGNSTAPATNVSNATTVNVSVNITGLVVGSYNATINITAPNATNINSSLLVPVTLSIQSPGNGGNGGGGGGGGGGGDGFPLLPLRTCTPDGLCCLLIPEGTIGLTAEGDSLETLILNEIPIPSSPTQGCLGFTKVYDVNPDGATFEPQITILFHYDADKIPEGMSAGELAITTWDEIAGEWIVLESSVNTIKNTISAGIRHFTPFTVLACAPSPPNFIASELSISPSEVHIGGEVIISVTIINTGELTGRHGVVLNINGAAVETKEVDLATGVSQKVTFTVTGGAMGTYHITIDGQTGKFNVLTSPPSWISQSWWLLLFVIIATGALVYFLVKPKREQEQSPEEGKREQGQSPEKEE